MNVFLEHGMIFFASCVLYVALRNGICPVFSAGIIVQFMFKRRLNKYHSNEPAVAGIANSVTEYSMKSSVTLTRIVFGTQVLAMGDRTLTRYRNILRTLYIGFAIVFVWVVVWMVIIAPRPN